MLDDNNLYIDFSTKENSIQVVVHISDNVLRPMKQISIWTLVYRHEEVIKRIKNTTKLHVFTRVPVKFFPRKFDY